MKFANQLTRILLLTVFLLSSDSVLAQTQGDDNLRFGHEIMDAQDAAFGTLYQVVIGEDVEICWKYTQILGWNFIDALKFFFEFKWELAVINVGLVIHKSPIVYRECLLILNDFEYIDAMFTLFNEGPFTFKLSTQIVENLMFNFGDIMYNQIQAKDAMGKRNYTVFGETVARIVSDIFYINPTDEDVWSDVNSLIIESESSSKKVPSSFYGALTVEAANPTTWSQWTHKPVKAIKKVSKMLGDVMQHQEPRIRDAKTRTKRAKTEDFMNVEAFRDGDLEQKAIGEMVEEMSPKYQRQQQIKRAYEKEQESIDELEAALRAL